MKKNVLKLVPQLRFSEFKKPLNLTYLGEILDFKNGINADKSQYGSGKKFINVLDIINNAPIYYDSIIGNVNINEKDFQRNNVKYGDILFQRSSEIREEAGQSNIYLDKNQDATFGGFVIRGRPKTNFNPIYFNYLLKTSSIRKEITNRSGGSTRFNVGQDSLSQVPILICTSDKEQEKIASFLDSVTLRITQLRRQHELLETYKKGVMQKIFSQEIRFKQDDGKPFPDLEYKKLKNICSLIKDGTHGTHKDDPNGQFFLLSAKNVFNGRIIYDDSDRKISRTEFLSIYKNYSLEKNDVLLSIVGTIGRVAVFNGANNLAFQRSVAFFRFKKDNPVFLYYLMTSFLFQKELSKRQVTSAQPGIYLGDLGKILLFIPSLEEQEKIANFLSSIDKKIDAVSLQIEKMEEFKNGLLQKMFV